MKSLTIGHGSTVTIADDTHLKIEELIVEEGATLIVGLNETHRAANITLDFMGAKQGLLNYGTVRMYGELFKPTWTRLSNTASVGSETIELQDSVNWKVGQTIVVMTSVWFDCHPVYQKEWCRDQPHENEVREIAGMSQDGKILTLNETLTHSHYGGEEYQSEVILLSVALK